MHLKNREKCSLPDVYKNLNYYKLLLVIFVPWSL